MITMNATEFYYNVIRQLYIYGHKTSSIFKSRSYALARTIRIVVRNPIDFSKKAAITIFKNPKKIVNILAGKRTIQNWGKTQDNVRANYLEWIQGTETVFFDVEQQKKQARSIAQKPLISLITPVFDPPVGALRELIDSVLCQTYGNFELLMYNFGTKPEVEAVLDEYVSKDKRVRTRHHLTNKGIGENSNLCLKDTNGEYIALLDHDDSLMPNALFECVKAINETDADFLYSDKDKITEDGQRFDAFFKPDWSPEMALGGNYMTHFSLMRTNLVKDLGGWDSSTDGAQDWDLFLRIIDKSNKPIIHIPKILYHWRTVEGSTANGISSKPYAMAAQVKAVSKHLAQRGIDCKPFHDPEGQMYIEWPQARGRYLFLVHRLFGDDDNIEKLVLDILKQPAFTDGSRVAILYRLEDTPIDVIDSVDRIKDIHDRVNIYTYKTDSLVAEIKSIADESKYDGVIYIADSIGPIENVEDDKSWVDQLTGWLSIPGVSIAGGSQYGDDGRLVDVGSYYDTDNNQFYKYHFGTGFRSGYNGYIQWIRNFVLVSERVFCFKQEILGDVVSSFDDIVDYEFAKALAVVNFANDGRAVYDPLIRTSDKAPFELSMPLTKGLRLFISTKAQRLTLGDPYYNINLDQHYADPRPRNLSDAKVSNNEGAYVINAM